MFEDDNPQEHWDKQSQAYKRIFSTSFQEFSENLPIEVAFRLADRSLRCIEEGTAGGLHLAGSGLLLGEEKTLKFIEEARVDGVYSHAGCAAVAYYCEQNGLDTKRADKYAEDWAQTIAQKSGIPFLGHLGLLDLKRPAGFHIARVVYYDGTGRFNFSQVKDLPPGFTISRLFLEKEYALSQVERAVDVITGDQGFGSLISKKDPLLLLAVSAPMDRSLPVDELASELSEVAQKYNGLAQVQTLEGKL